MIGGIVFLGIEIQQNTEMIRAQMTQSRADTAVALAEANFNSEYIPVIIDKIDRAELRRYTGFLRAVFRNQENNFLQYRQGFLGDNIPRNAEAVVNELIARNSVGAAWWESQKLGFSDEFIEYVDTIVDRSEGQ